ncbi:permease prefix domain 1-containing protein [Xylanimonas ulmi]|uniref:Uncharacterized protein n=1 Tax=Xylanimonas ulmi TaxID=228973 RepID=A0A4Q7M475_9MICO|nr:permease prefix domain 1-containing protein [Xylanibacterium ulmi]RZS61707.1 hypothetical protein EV386_2018 [Xylanibacterium ulmi]
MTDRDDLTARYLEAAVAQVPPDQRDGLRRELTERIADTVDARRAAGAEPAAAEYATLAELGHPDRLAAEYLDRPLWLIGPRYYLLWRRLVRLVAPIAAAAGAVGAAIGAVAEGRTAAAVLGEAIGSGVEVAAFTAVGITAVLAVMERKVPAEDLDPSGGWRPERLPALTAPGARRARRTSIGDAVWLVLLGAFVLVAPGLPLVWRASEQVDVLNADTWAWLRWALVAIIAAELALTVVALARARWSWWQAGARAALDAATIAVVVPPLAAGRVLRPEAIVELGWSDGPELLGPGGVLTTVVVLAVVIACVADAVTGFVQAAREPR